MNGITEAHIFGTVRFGYSIHTSMKRQHQLQFLSNSDTINAFEINQFSNFVFEIHGAL